jgi:hypothetical protein
MLVQNAYLKTLNQMFSDQQSSSFNEIVISKQICEYCTNQLSVELKNENCIQQSNKVLGKFAFRKTGKHSTM